MRSTALSPLLHYLSRLRGPAAGADDLQLLQRFRASGDEEAFTQLVRRHGPTIWGMCRRVLGNDADAEDAFQATFVVLLRRAGVVRSGSVSAWLYRVAWRVATTARNRRRIAREDAATARIAGGQGPVESACSRELAVLLHEELQRLPERFRLPMVLCGLGGLSCQEAAQQLQWPKSSVAHRLARGRALLRSRLQRRGVALSATALGTTMSGDAAAALPPPLLKRAIAMAGGRKLIPPSVLAVADSITAGPSLMRLLLLFVALSLGASLAALAARPEPAAPPTPATPALAAAQPDEDGPLPAEALARVGSARLRHGGQIRSLSYSGDGRLLVSSSGPPWRAGGDLRRLVWDAHTGRLLHRSFTPGWEFFSWHDGMWSLEPDSDKGLALYDNGQTFDLGWFDIHTARAIRRLEASCHETCLASAGRVALLDDGKEFRVRNLASGKEYLRLARKIDPNQPLGLAGALYCLKFAPDGRTLACCESTDPCVIHLYDTATGKLQRTIQTQAKSQNGLLRMEFSADSSKLLLCATSKDELTLQVWKLPSGERLRQVKLQPADDNLKPYAKSAAAWTFGAPVALSVHFCAFSPDGRIGVLTAGFPDNEVVLIDLTTGNELRRIRYWSHCSAVAFAPRGDVLAIGTMSGEISQWEVATGRKLAASAECNEAFHRMQFSPDGRELLGWGGREKVRRIEWASGKELPGGCGSDEKPGRRVARSRDGKWLAVVRPPGDLAIQDTASGRDLLTLAPSPESTWWYAAFSPDGSRLYTAVWGDSLRVWDLKTLKELQPLSRQKHYFASLAMSADGRLLAAGLMDEGWMAERGPGQWQLLPRMPAKPAPPFGFDHEEVVVWDLASDRKLHQMRLKLGQSPHALDFSADGAFLAATGFDSGEAQAPFVTVWDMQTGRMLFLAHSKLEAGAVRVCCVAMSSDGRTVAAAGGFSDKIRLWEVASGQERHTIASGNCPIYALAFGLRGRLLASAGTAAPACVWNVSGCYGEPPSTKPFRAAEQDRLWTVLAGPDARAAFAALRQLLPRPGPAVEFLATRLEPPRVPEVHLRQLVSQLDAEDFQTREQATTALARAVEQAEPLLRQALQGHPSPEAAKRIQRLLEAAGAESNRLRQTRALETLEQIASDQSVALLRRLANRAADTALAREARQSLARLGRLSPPRP